MGGGFGSATGDLHNPLSIAISPGGVISVVDNPNLVQQYEADGDFVRAFGATGLAAGQFFSVVGSGADGDDNLYVTDTQLSRVQKFDAMGAFERTWGWGVSASELGSGFEVCTASCTSGTRGSGDGQFDGPVGIDVTTAGDSFVADRSNQRVQRFASDGSFLGKWGSAGTAEGEFSLPNSIAVDDEGYVYVAESANRRVQKFDTNGVFQVMWGKAVKTPGAGRERCTSGWRGPDERVGPRRWTGRHGVGDQQLHG
jgi:DNA-binding beta-propeller fold protein YncE